MAVGALFVLTAVVASGQPAAQPAFEVASVKKSSFPGMGEGRGRPTVKTTPGSLSMRNSSFKSCVQWAYNLKDYQVTGPGWIDSERYDIVAKAADPVPDDELRQMLQTMLADRFKLVCHREIKELPVYVLTVGKDGSKMKQSEGEGESNTKPQRGKMAVTVDHTSMAQFVDIIGLPLRRPVIDLTGLKGRYDFAIDLSGYLDMASTQKLMAEGHGAADMQSTMETAVMMALREQLGLKLESKKSPIDMIVVDKAEKVPTEN
jgi:uncharacterized protein (TIGR03435 family)